MKLIAPSMAYDRQIQAYRQEFLTHGGSMDGCGSLRRFDRTQDWLDQVEALKHAETTPSDLVPMTQYLYVRESDDKVVGVIQIRHRFNEFLEKYAGHIGYSVCPSERRKGYATQMLKLVLPECRALGIERVLVCCSNDNEGSRKAILHNGGVYESTVYLAERDVYLERYWIDATPAQKEDYSMEESIVIRKETARDHRAVENLVREAFWNVYRPGCLEHYVIHRLRDDPAFVPELDFVMEKDGAIIGQNMFMRALIRADDGRNIPIMTMGPICIAPAYKRQGYGKKLLDYSLEQAAALGCGALCFEGSIGFYGKSGFTYASRFGIRYHGLPEGADASFFLCRELIDGYLDGVTGEYAPPEGYFVCEREPEAFERFEAQFPAKEKLKLPGQLV